jgi:UDP-2,4-diacetamido-2,4,6-trideoxy-beta-L-altropyranose hydrolase
LSRSDAGPFLASRAGVPPHFPAELARSIATLIGLRAARTDDCERVWQLNNDPGVRAVSRCTAPIVADQHRRWFLDRLTDSATALYMIVDESGSAIGVVRLEHRGSHSEVSLAIDRDERGRGVGRAAIRAAVALSSARWPGLPMQALVAEDNHASRRCFEAARFSRVASEELGSRVFGIYRRDPTERAR